jgi:hypothetical protein
LNGEILGDQVGDVDEIFGLGDGSCAGMDHASIEATGKRCVDRVPFST